MDWIQLTQDRLGYRQKWFTFWTRAAVFQETSCSRELVRWGVFFLLSVSPSSMGRKHQLLSSSVPMDKCWTGVLK